MGANTFGRHFQIHSFGESHGPALGVVVEGCPAGVPFLWDLLKHKMDLRRPGRFPWMSSRKELDTPEILSGVFNGITLGTPLGIIVKNLSARPEDYSLIKTKPRPGHADHVWKQKFCHVDHRGGGRASGRETISRVIGGGVAEMFLKTASPKLKIKAVPVQIGPFKRTDLSKDRASHSQKNWFGSQTKEVEHFLIQKKAKGLSFGGAARIDITNAPAGLGQPVFRKLKSDLAGAFMSIGACYEVRLGGSLSDISLKEGSVLHKKAKKQKEAYGGILGGLSTGDTISFYLKFKPPASVLDIAKKGRHDPCIVPRAAGVVEAMAWLVMADHVLWRRQDNL